MVKFRYMFWFQCRTVLPMGWDASEFHGSFLEIPRTQSKEANLGAPGSREWFGEGEERLRKPVNSMLYQ